MRTRYFALALSLTLVACDILSQPQVPIPSETPSVIETEAPTPTVVVPEFTPTPAGPAEVVLVVWVVEEVAPQTETLGGQALLEQLTAFDDAHPDIQVEVYTKRQAGPGSTLEYLRSAPPVAPSVLPDIALLDHNNLIQAAREDLVVPIASLREEDLREDLQADLYQVALELGSVDDQLVGLPYVLDAQHVVYRRSLFEEPPTSFESVLEGPTVYAFPAGSTSGVNTTTLLQYLAAGGILIDTEGEPLLDATVLENVLMFYADAREAETLAADVFQQSTPEDTWALYLSGQTGIADVTASLYLAERSRVRSTEVSWVPTPDGEPFALVSGWSWVVITQDPERQEAAMALINYLMDPVNQGDYTLAANHLPSQRAALAVWGDDPYAPFANVLLENAVPLPEAALLNPVADALQDAVEAVMLRDVSPLQAAAQAAQSVSEASPES